MELAMAAVWNITAALKEKKKRSRIQIRKKIRSAETSDELTISNNTWIVLYNNKKEGTAELLSKDCVATKCYDGRCAEEWSSSEIRSWLRESYAESLESELRRLLFPVQKETDQKETIYLLSDAEYEKYESRFDKELASYGIGGANECNWWLRTSGESGYAKYVSYIRKNTDQALSGQVMGIRPALTIKYA